MKVYRSIEVFTPTTPARLTFVERAEVNESLVDALFTPGRQIIVYGPTGCGKTTLLENKLFQTYPSHLVTRCTAASTFDQIILSAFDQLNPFYVASTNRKSGSSVSAGLSADFGLIRSHIQSETSRNRDTASIRALPLQLTPERLATFVGAADRCWVIEDFHKVPPDDKTKVAQMLKVFMDAANEYPRVKIIAIGAVDAARQVIAYEPEMQNRIAEIGVPLMTESQIAQIVSKGQDLLNFVLEPSVAKAIAAYSSGLGSVCHQLCLNICFAAGISETCSSQFKIDRSHMEKALDRYLLDSSDTLKAAFDKALRRTRTREFDNCRLILNALATYESSGATHNQLLSEIRKTQPKYPASNLTIYLKQLQESDRANLVRFDPNSGHYSFSNPLYHAYAKCLFRIGEPKPKRYRTEAFDSTAYFEFDRELSRRLDDTAKKLAMLIAKDMVSKNAKRR